MSEDVTGPKSGWNNASEGMANSTVQQPERSKSNATKQLSKELISLY